MLSRKKNSKTESCFILLSTFLTIGPDAVLADRSCFTAGQIAGIIFVTSFTTFFTVIGIAMLLWYFYRNRTADKNCLASVESSAIKSGKTVHSERMSEREHKQVEAIILPSFLDKMTSCSSLACKYDDDTNDTEVEKSKIQSRQQQQLQKQQQRCSGSQLTPSDSEINGSMNILEEVIRNLLEKDTSPLGFQIAQRSDGICISYVEPNGPADRSGNIFVGKFFMIKRMMKYQRDKIKELTIAFENMPISDALTILSCASTYKIRLELERAILHNPIQPDCPEASEHLNNSLNLNQQYSTLCKSYSTSDLALRLQKVQMSNKAVSGGSFMSKQKYQLPRQTVINTIREEAPLTPETPTTLSPSSLNSDFTEKNKFGPAMMESFICEETIVISDPFPVVRSLRTSSNEISPESQNASSAVISEAYSKSNYTSTRSDISRQQLTPQISPPRIEYPALLLISEESQKVDKQRSQFIFSNGIRQNSVELSELTEPKRDSIVIEFEEKQGDQGDDDSYHQTDEETINLPSCNGTFDEMENNLHQINSEINNGASIKIPLTVVASNNAAIGAGYIEKDTVSNNNSNIANVERWTPHYTVVKNETSDDHHLSNRTDITESEFSKFSTDIRFLNNSEQAANVVMPSSIAPNQTKMNELNRKHIMGSSTPVILRKTINGDVIENENSHTSPKRSQLRKLSGNYGNNEVIAGKEVKKMNDTTVDDLKDEGNSRSNVPQRSPKWSPKFQSHIPVITRTPSVKSKNKHPKVESNKTVGSSVRNKTTDNTSKNDMNGASLYIAKKEALRKTHLPFSKINKNEEVDLNKERKARLEANQAFLQRQQDELRSLGVLP